MTAITKGGNVGLPASAGRVRVEVSWSGGPGLDAAALLLAANGKVRSDADMVFYNQPNSTEGTVRHLGKQGNRDALAVDLAGMPAIIETVAVTASAEGAPFSQVSGLSVRVVDDGSGAELARFDVPPAATETAFVLGELYKRGGAWKFRAVGQGWASGLAGLATDYGISVDDSPAPAAPAQAAPVPAAPVQAPARPAGGSISMSKGVRLQKQLQNQPPAMINMVKKAGVSLEKKGLSEHRARVALCLDISASMTSLYRSGKVQQLCERVLGLAVQFDDDGACDVFTFGTGGYEEGPLDLRNYQGWIQQLLGRRPLEGGTNYNRAMEAVRRFYFPDSGGGPRNSPRSDNLPVYVMFVTDGQTTDQNGTRNQVMWSSYEPLFWQFMALGQSTKNVIPDPSYDETKHAFTQPPQGYAQQPPGYPSQQPPPQQPPRRRGLFGGGGGGGGGGFAARLAAMATGDFKFLEELDDMQGRFLDNADFFSVADPASLPDGQLYDLMMDEYPGWVAQAKQRGLLPPG
ncbi:VWA domain-containing protein [Antrihabitans sp. YC2-6]|uniref:VWA domain-containing protein n=1 Tax=Antrihabitans sp. YC2-6 TaxID=2799498 RepID=UPI0018F4A457|nr:VWA domain-containing protein [Antrihabitans sp. YC2-6]MBJ8345110.1 VWA domain-containing protein [Antrihabitans sp. YC2-6]